MTQHYYTARPESGHDIRSHVIEICGLTLGFKTDSGVFSKTGLDEGTALLLETLPPLTGRVLDMGCGWGALGVTAAKMNPGAQFLLTDINERAAALAVENARANGACNVRVVTGNAFEHVDGTFDYVITNPPIRAGKAVIYPMFEESVKRLKPGGALFLVIRKQQGAVSAVKFLDELSGDVQVIARDKGYWIIRCGKGEA